MNGGFIIIFRKGDGNVFYQDSYGQFFPANYTKDFYTVPYGLGTHFDNKTGEQLCILRQTQFETIFKLVCQTAPLGVGGGGVNRRGPQGSQGAPGGPQGFQGVQGNQGTQGNQGFQGQGFQGSQGNQGDTGSQGFQGFQGNQGFQGTQGFQGVQGEQGTQGFQGSQGNQGNQGLQGFQGETGAQGFQGNQGVQGTQGFQGNQGFQGTQGFQGVQGVQGTQGFQGNQGVQGNQGFQGTQGTQGFQGTQGSQGSQGGIGALADVSFYRKTGTTTYENWYSSAIDSVTNSTAVMTLNTLRFVPFIVPPTITLDRISINVLVIGTPGSIARLGIYDSVNIVPTNLILDAGTVPVDSLGVKTIIINQTLTPGLYFLTINHNSATPVSIRGLNATAMPPVLGFTTSIPTNNNLYVSAPHVFAAFPATTDALTLTLETQIAPLLAIRRSA